MVLGRPELEQFIYALILATGEIVLMQENIMDILVEMKDNEVIPPNSIKSVTVQTGPTQVPFNSIGEFTLQVDPNSLNGDPPLIEVLPFHIDLPPNTNLDTFTVQIFNPTLHPITLHAHQTIGILTFTPTYDPSLIELNEQKALLKGVYPYITNVTNKYSLLDNPHDITKLRVGNINIDVRLDINDPEEKSKVNEIHINNELDESQQQELVRLLINYHKIFDNDGLNPNQVKQTDIEWTIDTGDHPPIRQRNYRYSPKVWELLNLRIKEFLAHGVISPSTSPWCNPIRPTLKPDNTIRFCLDLRKLNSITKKDAYPIQRIDEILDSLSKAKYFALLDLAAGYHQIPLAKKDREKTAFQTPEGLFEFNVLIEGATNGPAVFQRYMKSVLHGLVGTNCWVYIDDILVWGNTWPEFMKNLDKVLARLADHGLSVKAKKTYVGYQEILALGHIVGHGEVKPNPAKIKAVKDFPRPTDRKSVQRFLGLTNYYRRFIKNYSDIVHPIQMLNRNKTNFNWTKECEQAFIQIKDLLSSAPVLKLPDYNKPFIIQTDASGYGIGSILSQEYEDGLHPVQYISHELNPAEQNYSPTERECLAIIFAVKSFDIYLHQQPFILETDHKALSYLMSKNSPSKRLAKWAMMLSEYDFIIRYKKGQEMVHVDALSRAPLPSDDQNKLSAINLVSKSKSLVVCSTDIKDNNFFANNNKEPKLEKLMKTKDNSFLFYDKKSEYSGKYPIYIRTDTNLYINAYAAEHIPAQAYVCEYAGEIITMDEAERRFIQYSQKEDQLYCLLYIQLKDKIFVIDNQIPNIRNESPSEFRFGYCRYIYHSISKDNLYPKLIKNEKTGRYKLCLHAAKYIPAHEQLLFDYGSRVIRSTQFSARFRLPVVEQGVASYTRKEITNNNPEIPKIQSTIIKCIAANTDIKMEEKYDSKESEDPAAHVQIVDQLTINDNPSLIEKISQAQHIDDEIKPIIDYLTKRIIPADREIAAKLSREAKSYIYNPESGRLYYFNEKKAANKTTVALPRLVIPREYYTEILQHYHSSIFGGHFGLAKTWNHLARRFYWKTMFKDLLTFISHCINCQTKKKQNKANIPVGSIPPADFPFQRIAIDFLGPFQPDAHEFQHVLLFADYFSKYVVGVPTKDQTAKTIAKIFFEEIICKFGAPATLLSDRGTNFLGEIMSEIYKLMNVKKVNTTAYHPQCNGLVERFNQTLVNSLSALCDTRKSNWSEYIAPAIFTYNTTIQATIDEMPYVIIFGREPVIPGEETLDSNLPYESTNEYVTQLHDNFNYAWNYIKKRLDKAYEDYIRQNDKIKAIKTFKVGDKVLLYSIVIPSTDITRKFIHPWTGPYEVIEKLSLINYKIRDPARPLLKPKVVHVNRLKLYKPPIIKEPAINLPTNKDILQDTTIEEDKNQLELQPQTILEKLPEHEELLYEIEAIVDHAYTEDGELTFLIKWKGYPEDQNTWKRESELEKEAPDVLKYYKSITTIAPRSQIQRKRRKKIIQPQASLTFTPANINSINLTTQELEDNDTEITIIN